MCAMVTFPLAAILVILGKPVIEAWMGAKYISVSYPVLLVLIVPSTVMLMQVASSRVLFGMGKHKTLAKVTLLEGVANLVLSIILVRKYGIIGDAVGTAIPLTFTMLLFLPHHLCRILKLRLLSYLRHAFLLPIALNVPLVIVLLALQRWFVPHHLLQLSFQLSIGLAVYSVAVGWAVWKKKIWDVKGLSYDERDAEIGVELAEASRQEA
jgi:O-antigen/teichoic acid export membrane protein